MLKRYFDSVFSIILVLIDYSFNLLFYVEKRDSNFLGNLSFKA